LSPSADADCNEEFASPNDDEQEFQIIQAAFTMVITQFWTGTGAQKRRAATELFDNVVEVRAMRVCWQTRQYLMTNHHTESALVRFDDICAIT
jgi:hypothetical protein